MTDCQSKSELKYRFKVNFNISVTDEGLNRNPTCFIFKFPSMFMRINLKKEEKFTRRRCVSNSIINRKKNTKEINV